MKGKTHNHSLHCPGKPVISSSFCLIAAGPTLNPVLIHLSQWLVGAAVYLFYCKPCLHRVDSFVFLLFPHLQGTLLDWWNAKIQELTLLCFCACQVYSGNGMAVGYMCLCAIGYINMCLWGFLLAFCVNSCVRKVCMASEMAMPQLM